MEFISHPIPAALILLGVLVFVHEAGHFIVGRLCGIGVEIFSIGFGPPLLRFMRKGTDYRISAIPLGGYVKFYGMMRNEEIPSEMQGREFYNASLPKRAATMAAGPFANFILAVVAYAVLGFHGIPHPQAIVGEVQVGSAGEKAGLQFQDRIVSIDGRPVKTWNEMRDIISVSAGKLLNIGVQRNGAVRNFALTPDTVDAESITGTKTTVGRAGVARGSLTAVISVTSPNSPAAQAGLVTGERIISVKVGNLWQPIKYWRSFLRILNEQVSAGEKELRLRMQALDEKGQPIAAQTEREVVLAIASAKSVAASTFSDERAEHLGLSDAQLVVGQITENDVGDLKRGDRIIAWMGQRVANIYELSELVARNKLSFVNLMLMRDFKEITASVKLKQIEVQNPSGKETIGVLPMEFLAQIEEPEPYVELYPTVTSALAFGTRYTLQQSVVLVETLAKLISGNFPLKALGGPMLIAKVAGDSARAGWQAFINTMALISVNLAVINLFPIPVLDGGQLVICAVEGIRRKRLSELAMENYQRIGFVLILALVVLATYNDLSRFWASMLASVTGFFQ